MPMQIFESSGTFTLKAGTAYKVICVGGGQSGGVSINFASDGYNTIATYTHGNAGYVQPGAFVADSNAVVPVTVGTGGVPVHYGNPNNPPSGHNQQDGEASSFGSYVSAPGGSVKRSEKSGIRSDGIHGAPGFRFWEPRGTPYELLCGTGYGAGGSGSGSGLPGCVIVMW